MSMKSASAKARLRAPLSLAALLVGCNAIFEIEAGTPLDDESGGSGGTGGSGATGGSGGKGGVSGGSGGSNGGSTETGGSAGMGGSQSGGTDSGGTGGQSGAGGSSGGKGGGGGTVDSGGSSGMGGSGGIPVPTCACDSAVPDDGTLIQSFESGELGVLPFDDRTGVFYPFQGSDLEFE
jgi:hypothetical protein